MTRTGLTALACWLMAGCVAEPDGPPPARVLLQPGYLLDVQIEGAVVSRVIDPAGDFSIPYVGHVPAAGKTPRELEEFLEQALIERGLLASPSVTVQSPPRTRGKAPASSTPSTASASFGDHAAMARALSVSVSGSRAGS